MDNSSIPKPRLLNLPNRRGLLVNKGFWLALSLVVNGFIFGFGWTTTTSPEHRTNAYELPIAFVGTVWIVLIALLAVARWRLLRCPSPAADNARWWLSVLINCPLCTL